VNKLKDHYEKLILAVLVILLGYFALSRIFSGPDHIPEKLNAALSLPYELDIAQGMAELTFKNIHSLMPGQEISVIEDNGSVKEKIRIEGIILRRKAFVQIFLTNGEMVEGRLSSQEDLRIGEDWKKLRQPLTVGIGRSNQNFSFAEIRFIRSDHKVVFTSPPQYELEDFGLSFYQSKQTENLDVEIHDRIKWEQSNLEDNETIYDLFTPPVIYLVDGKLSTSQPQDPIAATEEEEPFGMELIRFSNEPYPYRLVSWIGETPYFEDTLVKNSPTSENNVRNRMEVGIPYKKLLDRKAGQPSLIKTTEEDNNKQLTVEKFVVQQYRDERIGGLQTIGRALVRDHKLGGDAFEINNKMTEVFAGNIKIEVRMTIEELEGKTFSFTTQDEGISFDFGDRVYSVLKIDPVAKNILVLKKGPGQELESEKVLELP
tara:strand:- start:4124 stop:5413 length:1290 start_codon:yes stop_codon:yes gene_type:complete